MNFIFMILNVSVRYDTRNIKVFFINEVKVDIVNYRYEWIKEAVTQERIEI